MTALDNPRPSALTLAALVTALVTGLVTALPAQAAPPDNDSIADARVVDRVPARIVQELGQATASRGDGRCVGGASAWYRYRPTTAGRVRVVTVGSGFDTVLAVFRGPRAHRRLVACNDDMGDATSAVQVRVAAGRRYWIPVSACCDAGARGGRSILRFYRPRPAAISAAVSTTAAGSVSGRLLVTGTYRCATPSVGYVEVAVSQRIGVRVARGTASQELGSCDATLRRWNVRIDSETGWAFQEGRASVTLLRGALDGFTTHEAERTAAVTVGTSPQAKRGR